MTKINISYLKIKPLSKITCRVYEKPLKTCIKAYRVSQKYRYGKKTQCTYYLSKSAKKIQVDAFISKQLSKQYVAFPGILYCLVARVIKVSAVKVLCATKLYPIFKDQLKEHLQYFLYFLSFICFLQGQRTMKSMNTKL